MLLIDVSSEPIMPKVTLNQSHIVESVYVYLEIGNLNLYYVTVLSYPSPPYSLQIDVGINIDTVHTNTANHAA